MLKTIANSHTELIICPHFWLQHMWTKSNCLFICFAVNQIDENLLTTIYYNVSKQIINFH